MRCPTCNGRGRQFIETPPSGSHYVECPGCSGAGLLERTLVTEDANGYQVAPSRMPIEMVKASDLDALLKIVRPALVDSLAALRAIDLGHKSAVSGSLRKLCNEIVAAMEATDQTYAGTNHQEPIP